MKARYFRRLRKAGTYYEVTVTAGLFGEFDLGTTYTVFEKSPKRAVRRIKERKGIPLFVSTSPREETWAHYRVKRKDKPNHHRHYTYY